MSAPSYKQDSHFLRVDTPAFGPDAILTAFSGTEAMSRLFSFSLDVQSTRDDVKPADIVGKKITWSVHFKDQPAPRYFNGIVSRFGIGTKAARGLRSYRLEVVPWLWLLTRTSNCRIFSKINKEKTTPEIIEDVFKLHGLTDYKPDLKRSPYPKWKYNVQYRETAFNYVSRLMEEAGIFYFFQHDNGKHTMILSDHKGSYKDVAENKLEFGADRGKSWNRVMTWDHQFEFRPGKWAHTDYNFETPSTNLLTSTNTTVPLPDAKKYEMFDYPGEYLVKGDGEADVKVRMEEDEAPYDVVTGSSGAVSFTAGGKFVIDQPNVREDAGKKFVLTSVRHEASEGSALNVGGTAATYTNSFTCVPDSVVVRPARVTPKPVVIGTQPAVVVGPKGQELYTDKYGRVQVQFFWDREGQRDENSTCWIRVAQVMAGKRWGASFWPRIGQEVLVAFHEGDPDQPVIIGMVYNAEQMPPYQGEGPDGKHKSDNKVSGYKSNTTLGGVGYNEWRFDDTKGQEQIFIHAEKDMDTRVKNDCRELVLHDRHLIVGSDKKPGDQKEKVFKDKHLHVVKNQLELIEGNLELSVGGTTDLLLEGEKKETNGADSHLHVKGNSNQKVDQKQSLTVGMDLHEKVGMNYAHESGMTVYIKAGMTMVFEAGLQLSLKVGGSFVDISPMGVSISGPMVLINSGGAAGSGQAPEPTEPQDAKKANPADPAVADDSKSGQKSAPG